MLNVKTGSSQATDPIVAVQELAEQIKQDESSFVLFYCSAEYDLDGLGAEINRVFAGANVIGCTSAGEISPAGYNKGTLIGLSVASQDFTVVSERIDSLDEFHLSRGEEVVQKLTAQLEGAGKTPTGNNTFGFLLVDGLSSQEEVVVNALHRSLTNIQLFGGSAGDGGRFQQTHVYHEGVFHANSAVFSLVHTTHPFKIFKTEHFSAQDEDIVVTEADISRRIVKEINGAPAAYEYARVMGVEEGQPLTSNMFAMRPVVVSIGGENFVRSIMHVNDDDSISFACAIDEGIVLSVAEAGDLIDNLKESMSEVEREIGPPQLILGCDCFFRLLEIEQKNIRSEVGRIFADYNVFAFSTYGEQYNGMHVNQTFTGVAIGA